MKKFIQKFILSFVVFSFALSILPGFPVSNFQSPCRNAAIILLSKGLDFNLLPTGRDIGSILCSISWRELFFPSLNVKNTIDGQMYICVLLSEFESLMFWSRIVGKQTCFVYEHKDFFKIRSGVLLSYLYLEIRPEREIWRGHMWKTKSVTNSTLYCFLVKF